MGFQYVFRHIGQSVIFSKHSLQVRCPQLLTFVAGHQKNQLKLNIRTLLLVGIGGAAGSMVRFMISGIVARAGNMQLPVATFGINIAGSFLIGLLFGLSIRENSALSQPMMLLLATGFCGA